MPSFKPASFNEKFLLKVQGKSVASDLQSFPGGTEPPTAVDPELSFTSQQRHKHGKFSSRTRAAAPSGSLTLTEAHLAVTGLLVVSTQTSCCAGLEQSKFHFVSNLISREAEPRYGFLVNILDPATPESGSRQALYATPLKLGANEHVSPSSQV